MGVLIGILDYYDNTDNIVFIDNKKKTITWIPRDLFSFSLMDRVNAAFSKGGLPLFEKVIRSFGFPVTHSLCVPRELCDHVLKNLSITVPVKNYVEFYFQLSPSEPIEDGKKIISFSPPFESLAGERIHQFLCARYRVNPCNTDPLPDFDRIERQQIFLNALLENRFDFTQFLSSTLVLSDPKVIESLTSIDTSYTNHLFREIYPFKIGRSEVLVRWRKNSKFKNRAIRAYIRFLNFYINCIRKIRGFYS